MSQRLVSRIALQVNRPATRCRLSVWLPSILCLAVSLVPAGGSGDEPASPEAFRAIYLPILDVLEAEYQSFEAEARLTYMVRRLRDKTADNSAWTIHCCADARNGSFQIQRSQNRNPTSTTANAPVTLTTGSHPAAAVFSFSPEGVFELRKSTADGAFAVHRLGDKERGRLNATAGMDHEPTFRCAHVAVESMRRLLTDARSKIVAVKSVPEESQGRLVEVEFALDKEWFGRARA